jgi:putative restriction endonuclease
LTVSAETKPLLDRVAGIRRHREGDFVAPNKPVTLLWALARLEEGKPRLVPFAQCEQELRRLLTAAGRPGTLPVHAFWRLQNDGLWEVVGEGELMIRIGSDEPTTTSLRESGWSGGFDEEVFDALRESASLREAVASILREQLREGPADPAQIPPAKTAKETVERLARDPRFRPEALHAYESRCVVCGWGAHPNGSPVALAAAHVHPLEHGGPDAPGNGFVLCFHHHALFDAGLFAYDDERRLVVSERWQEEDIGTMPPLAAYAGTPLFEPRVPAWRVREEHLAWHRENVFLGQVPLPSTIAQ